MNSIREKNVVFVIIGTIITMLFFSCSSVNSSINKSIQKREERKKVVALPICQKDSYPADKLEITPAEFKTDFKSIYIFHAGAGLGIIAYDEKNEITFEPSLQMLEDVFGPTLQILRTKGYTVKLAPNIGTDYPEKYLECRHCGDLKVETTKSFYFEQKEAKDECLFIGKNYTGLFKHLISKYPEAEQYQITALVSIYLDFGAIKPRMFLFDNREQILILESVVKEVELGDQHTAPTGYRFNQIPTSKGEGRVTTVRRAFDKMLEIFPNISGKSIPKKEKPIVRKAYSYQYHLGNRAPTVTEIKVSTTPPKYWNFTYPKK